MIENYFAELKEELDIIRENERDNLVKELRRNGFEVSSRGGRGVRYYTSQGRMEPYDLSHYKFIFAKKDSVGYFISFTPFEQDKSTHNYHPLVDRIGFYRYEGKYDPEKALKEMRILNADLPLNETDYEYIIAELNKAE